MFVMFMRDKQVSIHFRASVLSLYLFLLSWPENKRISRAIDTISFNQKYRLTSRAKLNEDDFRIS